MTGMNEAGEVLLLGASQVIREDLQRRLQVVRSVARRPSLPPPETPPVPESELLFYYGVPTRLSYYLHPFTQKCLRAQYRSRFEYPAEIASTVLHVEDALLGETTQGAALEHLPPRSSMHAVELDVRPLLRGRLPETLWSEVKQRAAARRRAERASRREERRIDVGEREGCRVETRAERGGVVLGAVCGGDDSGGGARHHGLHEFPHAAYQRSGTC